MNEIKIIGEINPASIAEPQAGPKKTGGPSFADAIQDALKDVSQIQNEAEQAIEAFAKGEVKDIQTVVVAMEKADLSLQTLLSVRNRLVSAYEEISRMQV